MQQITIGTAISKPGTIQYGHFEAFTHPTGHTEFFPIIIAQGRETGPCIWLTAGIHGSELAGPSIIYKLITQDLVNQLHGTIVAIPALSPTGLRTMRYVPYHTDTNPNRLWPDGKPTPPPDPDRDPPGVLELAYHRLFKDIKRTANYLIDYHNAWTGSLSFSFRDRVLYRSDLSDEAQVKEANELCAKQNEMLAVYGHTIVNEYPAEWYIKEKLHRSTSAAALLLARIPAFTVELGSGEVPDLAMVAASITGTKNVLRWAGMLAGEMEPITGIKVIGLEHPVRRSKSFKVDKPCIVLHSVDTGDVIKKGDPIAEIRDIYGRPLDDGFLYAPTDGLVLGRAHGILFYQNQTVLHVAIPDHEPLIAPYPDNYWSETYER